MKLVLKPNESDKEVLELLDTSKFCDVLAAILNRDIFAGSRFDTDMEHWIEQNGKCVINISVAKDQS